MRGTPPIPPLGEGGSVNITSINSARIPKPASVSETRGYTVGALDFDDEGEWHLVLKSWKRTMRAVCEREPAFAFYPRIQRSIEKIRGRGGKFVVARNFKNTSQLFGFACGEEGVLHFIFVKKWLRRQGVGSDLVAACGSPKFASAWNDSVAVSHLAQKFNIRRVDL